MGFESSCTATAMDIPMLIIELTVKVNITLNFQVQGHSTSNMQYFCNAVSL